MDIVRLPHNQDLPLPAYETEGSAGLDLRAAVEVLIVPGARAMVPTGIKIAVPDGAVGLICGRSGLATRSGIHPMPMPGVIDSDYRGELMICIVNLGHADFEISRGDRIAQLLIVPVVRAELEEVAELDETERGAGGFGSTGSA